MELTQLNYFLKVAETQHFTRAAKALNITQPTLSHSVQKLEEELGVTLFDREGRSVFLNSNGQALYDYCCFIFSELNNLRDQMNLQASGQYGTVNIALTLPDMIGSYLEFFLLENPGIHIHQMKAVSSQIKKLLEERAIDFGITIVPIDSPNINWELVIREEEGVFISKQHPLADRISISFYELKDEHFIVNNDSSDMMSLFMGRCKEAGFIPKITFEGTQNELIGHLVSKNYGVSFAAKNRDEFLRAVSPKGHLIHDTVFLKTDPVCYRDTGFATLRGRILSPAAKKLYNYLVSVFKLGPNNILKSYSQWNPK